MSLLLDTHVWIWSQEHPESIGRQTRERIEQASEILHVATISALEIARLVAGGLIELDGDLNDWIATSIDALQCRTLELSHGVAVASYRLPEPFHRDPADRILVATARAHDLAFVTADERILAYPHVKTLDARL